MSTEMDKELQTKLRTAYVQSIKLWTWLAENPGEGKLDSPFYEEIMSLANICAFCELNDQYNERFRTPCYLGPDVLCPLANPQYLAEPCCGGVFNEWEHAVSCGARECAGRHAQAILMRIKSAYEAFCQDYGR